MTGEALSTNLSGGYFLVKPATKDKSSSELVPPKLISASQCRTTILPDTWAYEGFHYSKEEQEDLAKKFGIRPDGLPQVRAWAESHLVSHEMEWPNVLSSPEMARNLVHELELSTNELLLIGLGYPAALIDSFGKEDDTVPPMLLAMLNKRIPMAPDGEILGYEVLGGEQFGYHSWLCYHHEEIGFEKFGFRPNKDGLIERLEDAKKIADYIDAEGTANGPWYPWLIVKYPI